MSPSYSELCQKIHRGFSLFLSRRSQNLLLPCILLPRSPFAGTVSVADAKEVQQTISRFAATLENVSNTTDASPFGFREQCCKESDLGIPDVVGTFLSDAIEAFPASLQLVQALYDCVHSVFMHAGTFLQHQECVSWIPLLVQALEPTNLCTFLNAHRDKAKSLFQPSDSELLQSTLITETEPYETLLVLSFYKAKQLPLLIQRLKDEKISLYAILY